MNNVKNIRLQLGLTLSELASVLGCTDGNVSHYEHQRQIPSVPTARRLIAYAASKGLHLTLDDIYTAPELTEPQQEV